MSVLNSRSQHPPNLEKTTVDPRNLRMKSVLVIGSTGLVGSKILDVADKLGYEAHGTHNARISNVARSHKLDITDRKATLDLIELLKPVAVVNTAALHNVDYCERHKEEAVRVNVEGTRNLALAASKLGCRLIQLSTDYVFDGKRGDYRESDRPNPPNFYGWTKLESERAASETSNYAVVRPSVIYGWNRFESTGIPSSSGKTVNFAMFVIDRLEKGQSVKVVRDQFSSPTFADNLADAMIRLIEYPKNDVFHTAGRSCVSRYEFALKIAEIFGFSRELVQPVESSEFKQVAERPKNSCLSVDKAERGLGMRFVTVEEGIRSMKAQAQLLARV
jgi:dTDP-4-dehydrorhamnose reductase